MRLVAVEIHCADVAAVAAFYRDVIGIDLVPGDDEATHFETAWGDWSKPDSGFLFFAIQPLSETYRTPTTGVEIGFDVDDLDAAHERIVAAGVRVLEPPTTRPWGRAASYLDPLGNVVQLNRG